MNGLKIPTSVTERVLARCGVEHPHADLDPRKPALVVIDLQNAFMHDDIGHAVCPAARDIVPEVDQLAAAVRATRRQCSGSRSAYDERAAIEWSNMDAMVKPEARLRRVAAMSEGSKGHDLWPDLDVRPEDEIVRKYRFSAFLPGTSELPYRLRARGFDTVLIAGTVTNVCCESSARDAMMSNFKTIMVTDANAAMTKAEHEASLIAFYLIFGDVMDTDFAIRRLTRNTAG